MASTSTSRDASLGPPPPYSEVEPASTAASSHAALQITSSAEPSHPSDSKTAISNLLVKVGVNPALTLSKINENKRTGIDICVVIDVSGSMGDAATVGDQEASGLTILDIVKHSVNTIIITMTDNDRLSIVSFTTSAKVELPMKAMNEEGKQAAKKVLDSLTPQYSTNLWGGLALGLQEFMKVREEDAKRNEHGQRLESIFLLTDGMPNVIPPRGHHAMLREYKDKMESTGGLPIINTFGFGYSLDSPLLKDLAVIGEGQYSFIPDSGFVGTTFIHATTALYTTFARRLRISISPMNGASLALKDGKIPGGFNIAQSDWGIEIEVGSLLYGQSRDIIVPLLIPKSQEGTPFASARIVCNPIGTLEILEVNQNCANRDESKQIEIMNQLHRLETAEMIENIVSEISKKWSSTTSYNQIRQLKNIPQNVLDEEKKKIQDQISRIENHVKNWQIAASTDRSNPKYRSLELQKDLQGQVLEAFDLNYYLKWGQHYLPSLARAHLLQVCNNFKDPGIQPYISEFAEKLRIKFDEIFLTLPPPKPTLTRSYSRGNSSSQPTRHVNMRTFHNSSNPCFSGDSRITMADGSIKRVDEVKKGDLVQANPTSNETAKIMCVLKTVVDGVAVLVKMNENLKITPYHPIIVGGRWKFPIDISRPMYQPCSAVYSYVLESANESADKTEDSQHAVVIGGIQCATLGHGLKGDVIEHEYLGTRKVLDDLERMRGWQEGLIVVAGTKTGDNELVCGFVETDVVSSILNRTDARVC